MGTYKITIDKALFEKVRPLFADDKEMELWIQQKAEELLHERYAFWLESQGK
jgi:hypothetical protein